MTRDADEPTIDPSTTRARSAAGAMPSSSSFVPGTIVAGRYRLVALLGRGGMGEVYRADDLTLDQPVALKFLPAGVALDDARLAQFHNELRTARQIAHKNVCRLFDLGEFDGRRFLTMEYVDGEDLASLLRRIGRLPEDKAVQIARQLCAGVSAAHERGVVHRDLKPANVMIDGDGDVRVTDFGLAASAGDQAAVWAGTPQYMAPEQLSGEPATIKSDIYALGLVLYEIFTGKRAHEAQTLDELRHRHASGSVSTPSTHVRDLDPAIERVIMRCLERDPASRPSSVLGVAGALPGGDPLAAALAAGETPSPELIAAAGRADALHPAIGLSLFAFMVVGLFVLGMVNSRTILVTRIPFDRSLEVLQDRAEEAIRELGYVEEPADSARGLLNSNDALAWIARTDQSSTRWNRLASGSFPTLRFWYRTSPQPLDTDEPAPRFVEPPFTTPRMLSATFDTVGRLTSLAAIPPVRDGAVTRTSMDWSRLFDAAGLSMNKFRSVPATRTPTAFADERAAWEGPLHEHDDVTVRVEAAAHEGLPVFFVMTGPWARDTGAGSSMNASWLNWMIDQFTQVWPIGVILAGALLARRHYRSRRADLHTANRAFLAIVVIWIAIWVFERRHVADVGREWDNFYGVLRSYLMNAGFFWLMYVALEPFARRYTPEMLFSWTRLMRGEIRDPRVGRDILLALVVAMTLSLLWLFAPYLAGVFGQPPPVPRGVEPQFLLSSGNAIARTLRYVPNALQNTMLFTFVFVVARALIGRLWPAAIVVFAVNAFLGTAESGFEPVAFVLGSVFGAAMIAVLIRIGVFALATTWLTFFVLTRGPITTDFSTPYGAVSAWLMLIVSTLAAYAFYASRGGQPLLGARFN